jgi:imidazolonepropionase-like amidohydrolase
VILIENGKFLRVGRDLEIPAAAQVIDATGKFVVAGLIDAHTHIGASGFNETTNPVTPHVRGIDALDLSDPGFGEALAGGVTTIITTPGSANVICGTGLVMKTAGKSLKERTLRNPAGMKMAWRKGTSRPSQGTPYPVSHMGIAGILRNALVETQNYMVRREKGEVEKDLGLEMLAQVLRRELPARIHSFTPIELMAIMRIQDEFGFDFTVEHGFEAHLVADHLAERGIPVVYGPGPGSRRHKMFPRRGPHGAAILHKAGVKVSLQTDHPDRSIKEHRIFGAILLRYTDLTPDDVLRMLTINGAEIAGVADRVGSIEVGKDADFAIYSDHPLKVQARVEQVFISGAQVWHDGQVTAEPYG